MAKQTTGQTSKARHLRKTMSRSQRSLWERLRANRIGFHFRREVPIDDYTLDFYCAAAQLCVEVDGDQHEIHTARDAERDANLAARGILTLRFSSTDCFTNSEGVAQVIERTCKERTATSPS